MGSSKPCANSTAETRATSTLERLECRLTQCMAGCPGKPGQVLALKQFQGNARTASVRAQDTRLFVVQWIERGPPKAEMQVRFLPGRPKKALLPNVDASGKPASKPAKFTSQIHQPNSPAKFTSQIHQPTKKCGLLRLGSAKNFFARDFVFELIWRVGVQAAQIIFCNGVHQKRQWVFLTRTRQHHIVRGVPAHPIALPAAK